MVIKILKLDEIDFNRIVITKPDVKLDCSLVHILYDDPTDGFIPFLFELPDLYVNDPIILYNNKHIVGELVLTLFGRTVDTTQNVVTFFKKLDEKILEFASQNKKEWSRISCGLSTESNKQLHYKMVIRSMENDSSIYLNGVLKLKLMNTSTFSTTVFNSNKEKILSNGILSNTLTSPYYFKSIIELPSIWIKDGVFGMHLRLHQGKVTFDKPPTYILSNGSNDSNDNNDSNTSSIDSEDYKFFLVSEGVEGELVLE